MKPPKQPGLKAFLRDTCLPALSQEAPYFPIKDIRRFLSAQAVPFKERTLVRYLHDFVGNSLIHDAGRGFNGAFP